MTDTPKTVATGTPAADPATVHVPPVVTPTVAATDKMAVPPAAAKAEAAHDAPKA
jgi:hypothetical protein